MEAELAEVKREIAAIKFLLSDRRVGDPENPYIAVYEASSKEKLENYLTQLQTEKHDLQTKENLLLQKDIAQTQAGNRFISYRCLDKIFSLEMLVAPEPDWEHVKRCIVQFSNDLAVGQGIAVSPRLILTALHGTVQNGTPFNITNILSEARSGAVFNQWFEVNVRDIALIKLNDDQQPFQHFLNILERPVKQNEKIMVVSMIPNLLGVLKFASQDSKVFMIEDTTLCRAQYYAIDGFSGCGAITEVQPNGEVLVVGVHVASHDNTEEPPPIKKLKGSKAADHESVSSSSNSLSKSIHGHTAYSLICIANLVPELMTEISNDRLPAQTPTITATNP